jgi:hypothetical protein
LFVRQARKVRSAKSYGEFAFNASLLRSQEAVEIELSMEPAAEPRGWLAGIRALRSKWRSRLSVAATWGITVVATIWLMNAYDLSTRAQVDPAESRLMTDSRSLGLKLDRTGTLLEILWNQDLSSTRDAKQAAVTISNGRLTKEIKLNQAQIRVGHLYCEPQTSDLDIRMEVATADGETTSESVRLVSSPSMSFIQTGR